MTKLLTHTRRPDIIFYKSGRILITARVARLLTLNTGDVINIAVDGGEHLLFAGKDMFGRHEARCHPSKKGGRTFVANSTRLCRAMLEICNANGDRASLMIGEPTVRGGVTYLPVITSHLL